MDTKYGDTPTLQSKDSRRETREITHIYKTKRMMQLTTATLLESITVEGKVNDKERARNGENESERNSALSWKTTCTGNVVANGRKWTVVEEEYDEGKRQREQAATSDGWRQRREKMGKEVREGGGRRRRR
jgi:hypothetical protein